MSVLARKLQMAAAGSAGADPEATWNKVKALYHFDGASGSGNSGWAASGGSLAPTFYAGGGDPYQSEGGPFRRPHGCWSALYDGVSEATLYTGRTVFSTSDFTVEFWISFVTLGLDKFIFDCRYSGGTSHTYLHTSSGSNSGPWSLGTASGNYRDSGITNDDINLGAWHHIAICRSSGTLKVFLDGVEKTSVSDTDTYSGTQWTIGNRFSYNSNGVNAYISNFKVHYQATYTSAFTPPTTPLTAGTWTELLIHQSHMAVDNSNYASSLPAGSYPGGLTNGPLVKPDAPFNYNGTDNADYDPSTHGGAADFDGNDWFYSSAISVNPNWTIDFWFYPRDSGSYSAIIGNTSTPYYQTQIAYNVHMLSGVLYLGRSTGYSYYDTAIGTPQQNAWNHIAICRQQTPSTRTAAWLNGVRTLDSATNTQGSPGQFILGRFYSDYNAYHYNGKIANFRLISNYCEHMVSGSAPTSITIPTGLVGNSADTSGSADTKLIMNFECNLIDSTGQNDTLVNGSAQVLSGQKKFGATSAWFSAADLNIKHVPILQDFTMEFWMFRTTFPAWGAILSSANYYSSGAINNWIIRTEGTTGLGLAHFTNGTSGGTTKNWTVPTMSTSTWYHVAIVRSGSEVRAYLDGTESTSGALTLSTDFTDHHTNGLKVGRGTSNTDYSGYLDELRITAEAVYTSDFTPPADAFPNS